ncbi:hypothetical protein EV368DRAFT_69663 [Lentinula lateritia]|nr:hypothetical protein EV368DRAFT_69663 [Lentinula lateritia]
MTLVLSRSGSLSSLSSLSTIATPTTARTSPQPPHSSFPPGHTSSSSSSSPQNPQPTHTPRPLQEEKTEPYYADDSYKDPPPPPHVLTAEFGVKIRDFAHEKGGVEVRRVKKYVRREQGQGVGTWTGGKREPVLIQRQPTPPRQKNWSISGGYGNAEASTSSGLTRQRVVQDIDDLEVYSQSQSQSQSQPQSLPPLALEHMTFQEFDGEPYIETPTVTPNGSLHWKTATPPEKEELTLPSLHNLPFSSSHKKRASEPDDDDDQQHHTTTTTPPRPPTKKRRVPTAVSPTKPYNLRDRRPAATGVQQTRLPPSRLRNIVSVESSQSRPSTIPKRRGKRKAKTTRV